MLQRSCRGEPGSENGYGLSTWTILKNPSSSLMVYTISLLSQITGSPLLKCNPNWHEVFLKTTLVRSISDIVQPAGDGLSACC